jgi:multicomponent Na+:H+ antiporter subunit E
MVMLIIVWVFLWDSVSGMTILSGLVVAFTVVRAFYLPPIQLSGRLPLFSGTDFGFWVMLTVRLSSSQVAWLTVRPRPVAAGSVVAVDLATRSDLLITLVTMVNGLIPGSLVIEIDRARAVVFVHGLNCADEDEIEKVREKTHGIETLLIYAIGSPHDIEALNDARRERGQRPRLESLTIRERARRARMHKEARGNG